MLGATKAFPLPNVPHTRRRGSTNKMIVRRSDVPLIVLCAVLLFLVYQRVLLPRSVLSHHSHATIYHTPESTRKGSFDWAHLPQHHPVPEFIPLPKPWSKRLPTVQHEFGEESPQERSRRLSYRDAVASVLRRSWTSYRKHAWLKDELTPISGSSKTTFGGWAATLVDSLDILYIAGMREDFDEAVNATLQIDFSTSTMDNINIFETTIRYLGGFIAAYDLSGDPRLLNKGLELAEMIYHAFDTPNRMPITRWFIHDAAKGESQVADEGVLSAEIGSLELELTRLSQITNDPRWYDAGARVMKVFEQEQQKSNLPGMWPLVINAKKQDFHTGTVFTLGAMADSLYEYLPKMYALLGGSTQYARLFTESMRPAIAHSLYRPMVPDDADILLTGPVIAEKGEPPVVKAEGQHLVCFAGGMLALGGRLLKQPDYVDYGRRLTDGCIWAYDHSALGIMPETFNMLACEDAAACAWNRTQWAAEAWRLSGGHAAKDPDELVESQRLPEGFTKMHDRRYVLRPEAIESVFYLYRITGDPKYQTAAWRMFQNIDKHTRTDLANAALLDVSDPTAPKSDSMESFWTAETLKYFYLIFSDPNLISLDEWVFSTEAHPFRRPATRGFWG